MTPPMFTKIGHILPSTFEKSGIAPKVARARVFALFEQAARGKLAPTQFGDFKVLHVKDAALTIACKSSTVANILRSAEPELLEASARTGVAIERLRFLLAPWR